ncbi:FtsK/SpoIIIE domain-containing protein [Phytohabitans sp. ZYX-F-186]|uniref:FtsK/SpoIIIE domain-containing protein n=1 Tax=Phytohabitans maris TaxID=3071409 RepID=A0ABU0ZV52_9ACTN|nr:FtsK/SpoIIIE domain-containing protein [Phytohabitans sp. ZYX-F-186]MDQ7910209.1 FtsK/SpoIIIE domain-containing protein [Phytohabitans sp. ZYX-F-186]
MSPVLVATTPDDTAVPLGPTLSIFDPVYIGIDEFGHPVTVPLIYRNLLIGGEPGSGKSALLNAVVAHAALSLDCRLCLLDAKRVELGQWRRCADAFVGPSLPDALALLSRLQIMMDRRYDYLEECERRKVVPDDRYITPYLIALDEFAYYSATVGKKAQREEFSELLRDLVARGRAAGIIVVAATQRPSSDIIPTSLRDLFAWRFAGRCTTDSSSDIVLGHGKAQQGWTANTISPTNPGAGLLIAEGGTPQLVKVAYLDDATCAAIARYAATLRNTVASKPQPRVAA